MSAIMSAIVLLIKAGVGMTSTLVVAGAVGAGMVVLAVSGPW
jgi:hypothetical protein